MKFKPLFKYTGGKYSEYPYFEEFLPTEIENYYEPFCGSAGVYLQLKNENRIHGHSYLNDLSSDLINFYRHVGNIDMKERLELINRQWLSMRRLSCLLHESMGDEFGKYIRNQENNFNRRDVFDFVHSFIKSAFDFDLMDSVSKLHLSQTITASVMDKAERFARKANFGDETNLEINCLSTAVHSGYYFYIRSLYNEWLLNNNSHFSETEKAAQWYFVREMCFGAMHRFSRDGKFNVPYGGATYNLKNMNDKIEYMFLGPVVNTFKENIDYTSLDFADALNVQFNENDFIFLDPPYDTVFTSYDGRAFSREDHIRLSNVLKGIKCKWMMVIKQTDFIDSLYKGWTTIRYFPKTYKFKARGEYENNVNHLIITNY